MNEGDRFASDEGRTHWLRHACEWSFLGAKPKRLGVAVSGGSDSMALLDLMAWHCAEKGIEIFAVTVDHGLRAEAKDEIALVAKYCAKRGVPHSVLRWEWDGQGNLQGKARKARYALISAWAERKGVDVVALGHTQDDQAETVLMRLARQSGVDGLAGMSRRFERNGLVWIRPFLFGLERSDLQDYLTSQGILWCNDPTNEDDSFERVRARRAMAALSEIGIDSETLWMVASNADAARSALDHYAWREVAENEIVTMDHGDLIFPEHFLTPRTQVPAEVGRRILIGALKWMSGAEYPPRRSAIIGIDVGLMDADRHTVAGCLISRIKAKRRIDQKLRITREYNAVKDTTSSTDTLWDGRWVLDGPHDADLQVRALGEAVKDCPDWRETGLPRQSLLATPAIWRGEELVAAPVAGLKNGWEATATGRGSFAQFLLSR